MDARLIAVASPIFFLLIFVERTLLRKRKEPVYRLHDSLADLSCGVGEQICQVFTFLLELALYSYMWTHFRIHTFSIRSVGAWILLVLLLDLAYYWFHRASHRVNFLWAVHSVHHQSEEYNFAVALRQGWLEPLMIAPFHIPIALLGFPPEMFFIGFTAHTLWQFWPHTRGIGALAIDRYFNSPANHRCHHAINPEYIDTNYGGLLIVWDRLFGTYVQECDEVAFGTVKPLSSFNPLWANLSYWVEMGRLAVATPRVLDRLSLPFRPPEWRPAELGGPVTIPPVSRSTQPRYAVVAPRAVNAYAVGLFAFVILVLPLLTQAPPWLVWTWSSRAAAAALLVTSLVNVSGLVEHKAWAVPLEIARLCSLPAIVWIIVGRSHGLIAIAAGLALVGGVWLAWVQRGSSLRPSA